MRLPHIILVLLILAVTSPAFGTALHEAVVKNDIAAIKQLLAAGADVNASDEHGMTALAMVEDRHVEIAKLLISAGAEVNAKNYATIPRGIVSSSVLLSALPLARSRPALPVIGVWGRPC